ncbi:hypothetical protein RCO15_11630, partial [Escherichia coli]|nr:hypothetical protein [Escherichia coli]
EGKRINRTCKQNVRNAIRTLSAAVNQQQHQNLQLNHTTQSQSRIARLKPVYRQPRPKNKNHQHQNRFSYPENVTFQHTIKTVNHR